MCVCSCDEGLETWSLDRESSSVSEGIDVDLVFLLIQAIDKKE